ncbi:PspC domain-containing protein [Candidatus Nanohalobium constans]|uniref:Phage shock protein C n=1 Tax=Candidatus Nanohalobium constans TaxID=2565781 RepID=A0A5Q0UFF9_9ARCH|nr:PspC domain-containing protein [Candidatus Nanohalobium constans]QGA80101.1 phage shock protein C [Candidatus Nanohalobium constans]
MSDNRLYRSEEDKILGGVCGGIAEVYDLDPSLVRIATLLLVIGQIGILGYIAAWLIIPTESEVKNHKNVKDVEAEKVEDEEEE